MSLQLGCETDLLRDRVHLLFWPVQIAGYGSHEQASMCMHDPEHGRKANIPHEVTQLVETISRLFDTRICDPVGIAVTERSIVRDINDLRQQSGQFLGGSVSSPPVLPMLTPSSPQSSRPTDRADYTARRAQPVSRI
ncbi:hypothetical protein [Streptomyces sp. NBC_00658]|uniref:hypothetical protein n=1 Tax=Streptomyces sp. NBC_00658 TaxID=2975800 RepID=UPI003244066A